jgi:hypothetical protein
MAQNFGENQNENQPVYRSYHETENSQTYDGARVKEDLKVAGRQAMSKLGEVIHEGNVRLLSVKHKGNTVVELPLTVVAIGTVLVPPLAIVGLGIAIYKECVITVERRAA